MSASVWAISTNKGGVLKTSITTNLAGLLAAKGKVLIIDADNQGNVALTFGKNPDNYNMTLYDLMVGNEVTTKDCIVNVYKNIDIIPANDEMTFLDFDVLTERNKYPRPFHIMRGTLNALKDKYDYILVDTPPNIGLVTGNVLTFADKVIIPFQPETYSQRSLMKMLNAIEKFKEQHNPGLSILGVVGTLVDTRTSLHSEMLSKLRQKCLSIDIKCFDTVIPRSVRFASSVAFEGLPATITDKKQPVVNAYIQLLNEIMEELK